MRVVQGRNVADDSRLGFTLTEALIATALVVIAAVGIYSAGLMVRRLVAFNGACLESRALAVQQLEEISARGLDGVMVQAPYAPLTNRLANGLEAVRHVTVIGHAADRSVNSNLAQCAYAEIHVDVVFYSAFTKDAVSNRFSTLVD